MNQTGKLIIILLLCISPLYCGCTTWDIDSVRRIATLTDFGTRTGVEIRKHRDNPLQQTLNLVGHGGPKPSEQTEQYLRRLDMLDNYQANPKAFLEQFQEASTAETNLPQLNVLAELCFVQGEKERLAGNDSEAGEMLVSAAMASHRYLFDQRLDSYRNAYDPQFRRVCDIYNSSLEGILRIMRDQDALKPGGSFQATSLGGDPIQMNVVMDGRWRNQDFDKFEFVSDFDTEGLQNVYHTYGLGVPLIGVRASGDNEEVTEQYYPAGLTLPLTAFFHVMHDDFNSLNRNPVKQCVMQLIDPLETTQVSVHGRMAPLESDITTPLAYYLDDPLLSTKWFATIALLDGDFAKQFRGLYMLEPYDPNKIPVVMVHGLWSSPVTWTAMFNDLRANKRLRDNYQFWFYLYPTGQPFWVSARDMRNDLNEARQAFDPAYESAALDHMVLVGHSMGGLVSRMQTIQSGDEFWNIVSEQSIEQLEGEEEAIDDLRQVMYFEANPSVRRVITLGTPHKGSNFANSLTKWVSHKLFRLPTTTTRFGNIVKSNPETFGNPRFLTINTSIDSLSPDSPAFAALERAPRSPIVRYHNIVGEHEVGGIQGMLGIAGKRSDGVVGVDSAMSFDAESVITVNAEHSFVHQHPRSVLEVQRILMQHLDETIGPSHMQNVRFDEPLCGQVPYGADKVQMGDGRAPVSKDRLQR